MAEIEELKRKHEEDPRRHLPPEYFEIERRCLENSGIPFEEFKVHNVEVDDQGHYVRTFEVGMAK